MDDYKTIQKEIILHLSECLDFSIKAANQSSRDITEDNIHLKALYDILSTLLYLEEKDLDENTQ